MLGWCVRARTLHTHARTLLHRIAIHIYLFRWSAYSDPYISVATHKMHPFLLPFCFTCISLSICLSADSSDFGLSWRIHWMRLRLYLCFFFHIFIHFSSFVFSFSGLSCFFHSVCYAHKQRLNGKRQCQTLWLQRIVTQIYTTAICTQKTRFRAVSHIYTKEVEDEEKNVLSHKCASWFLVVVFCCFFRFSFSYLSVSAHKTDARYHSPLDLVMCTWFFANTIIISWFGSTKTSAR